MTPKCMAYTALGWYLHTTWLICKATPIESIVLLCFKTSCSIYVTEHEKQGLCAQNTYTCSYFSMYLHFYKSY